MTKIEKKSIKYNMVLNAIKSLMTVIFPFITFPYISRILGVDNLGKYNFANSILSYFLLIAELGISTYAIRNGSSIRNEKDKFIEFSNQIFTIHFVSTIFSYILLIITLITIPALQEYVPILCILSLQIIGKTIGVEWIYSIYEDYVYITIRSVVFQILSIILMFVFVHKKSDLNIYAVIIVISSVGSNIINYSYAKKYCKLRLTIKLNIKKHIKSILLFFATAITVTIYVSSDITILGFLCNDYIVGIYSVSVKVYTILKSVLSSIIVVSIPRMSAYWWNYQKKEFYVLGSEIYQIFLTFIFPAIFGLIILSREIITIIAGSDYLSAQSSFILLSIALFFCIGAGFWSQGILIPQKKEAKVFKITIFSAIVNIGLNFIMIPFWKEKAAALTTIIAEGIVFLYCRKKASNTIKLGGIYKLLLKVIIGCIPMVVISYFVKVFITHLVLRTIVTIILCVLEYFIAELLLRNHIMKLFIDKIQRIIFQK